MTCERAEIFQGNTLRCPQTATHQAVRKEGWESDNPTQVWYFCEWHAREKMRAKTWGIAALSRVYGKK